LQRSNFSIFNRALERGSGRDKAQLNQMVDKKEKKIVDFL
jgi:hypothetical protein